MKGLAILIAGAFVFLGTGGAFSQVQNPLTGPRESDGGVSLSTVSDPVRTLTNLTVYSDGKDIGHVGKVELGGAGTPRRVQILFNDDQTIVWLDAQRVSYNPGARMVTTPIAPERLKDMAAQRVR